MSKEKQIEEMANILLETSRQVSTDKSKNKSYAVFDRDTIFKYGCDRLNGATALYEQGYRKQSENVIELPCKIGDTVYIIDEADDECGEDYVLAVKVLQFFINEHGIAVDLALPLGLRQNTWMVVGKNVFLTREEAEAHMRKEDEGKCQK